MSARTAYEYHLRNWSDIQEHLPRLFEAAKGQCLEIGTRSGVSTSALLAGVEEHGGHVYSIDINDCSSVFFGHPQWEFVQSDTQTQSPFLVALCAKPDVLFVDGDHTFQGALSDLMNFGTGAKVIFVHDTDCPDTFPGVRKAVETFCEETKRSVIYHHGSYGMAEIR